MIISGRPVPVLFICSTRDIRLDCGLTMRILDPTYTTCHQAYIDRKMVCLAGCQEGGSSGPRSELGSRSLNG